MLMGRVSYDEFAPIWPTMDEDSPSTTRCPSTWCRARSPTRDWNNTSVLRSLDDVAGLKQSDGGNIIVHGSATLAQGLAAAGLVDRYHLLVFPLLLGDGKRLFAGGDATTNLDVVGARDLLQRRRQVRLRRGALSDGLVHVPNARSRSCPLRRRRNGGPHVA